MVGHLYAVNYKLPICLSRIFRWICMLIRYLLVTHVDKWWTEFIWLKWRAHSAWNARGECCFCFELNIKKSMCQSQACEWHLAEECWEWWALACVWPAATSSWVECICRKLCEKLTTITTINGARIQLLMSHAFEN